MKNDQRWLQRFENFENAHTVFVRRIEEYKKFPTQEAYQMALIQGFKIVIELACKTMEDYLENEGFDEAKNSKQTVREAFKSGLISDGEAWMGALEKRNSTSHVYNSDILRETLNFIYKTFNPVLSDLFLKLKAAKSMNYGLNKKTA